MQIIPSEAARHAAFQTIRENALDAMSNPGVSARLGEVAGELLNETEAMFYVPRHGDKVALPENELDHENIGLHPVLRRDITLPDVQAFALRLGRHSMDDLAAIDPTSAQVSEIVAIKPFRPHGKSLRNITDQPLFNMSPLVHNVPVNKATGREAFIATPRALLGSFKLEKLPPPQIAAALGHYIEYLIVHEELVSSLQTNLPHANPDNQVAGWQYRTTIERSAYYVAGEILEANKVKPTVPLDDAKGLIRDLGPQEAGEALAGITSHEEIGRPPVPAYIAATAISQKFGTGELTAYAQPDEATAYQHAGLLH
jgi:hypothetical protein